MTRGLRGLACLALLAGCATDNSPQGVCARRAYDDPVVKQLLADSAASTAFAMDHEDDLKRAKQAETTKCLQQMGIVPPGGVEMVVPPR